MPVIQSIEQLEALYGTPRETATIKEVASITPHYRQLIEASPFVALATSGPEGLDCSPRGDAAGFVHIKDKKTLMMPDRRGNNRVDSLRNIVRDPRVALLFLIPGSGTTLRVNGRAHLSTDADLSALFTTDGQPPRSVIVIAVEAIYFQCARAILRARLWDPSQHVATPSLPTPGQILTELSKGRIDGDTYDAEWPERANQTLW